MSFNTPGELRDLALLEAKDSPLVHRLCAKLLVETHGWLVPIQHRPLHSSATTLVRDLRQPDEEGAAVALATHGWPNEQIFEIKTWPAEPGGEVEEVNRETDRLFILEREQDVSGWLGTEQHVPQSFFRRDRCFRCTLVFSQLANQLRNHW